MDYAWTTQRLRTCRNNHSAMTGTRKTLVMISSVWVFYPVVAAVGVTHISSRKTTVLAYINAPLTQSRDFHRWLPGSRAERLCWRLIPSADGELIRTLAVGQASERWKPHPSFAGALEFCLWAAVQIVHMNID